MIPYRLARPSLGRGGYAEVFRADRRDGAGESVALKRGLDETKEGNARLRREISVQRALDHPNVMPILDADPIEGWYTMPLAAGSLLKLHVDGRLGRPPHEVALDVIDHVSRGLQHAHEIGYVHRDVTPGNILAYVEDDGSIRWVIGDWGLVRRPLGKTSHPLTGNQGLGTAGFAAPETYEGNAHEVDPRADVYSLGRVVAWLLTGRWPQPNLPLAVDGPLRGFVAECTSLEPDRRPETMEAMRQRLVELTSEPEVGPRGQVQALLENAARDAESAKRAVQIGLRNAGSDEIWVDEIARLPLDQVADLTREAPRRAAEAGNVMLGHLTSGAWGDRDFNYLNTPLRWVHEVIRVLTVEGELGLAEDLAVPFFERDAYWDRFRQKGVTVGWLRSLEEPEGRVMRSALRRARAQDYYRDAMTAGRILSRSLAAEFGR